MQPIQKAMVLMDLARDEIIRQRDHYPEGHGDRPDLDDAAEDIGAILAVLESFANWPRWSA